MSTISKVLGILALFCTISRGADVQNKIDWADFLGRHDLVFNHLSNQWGEGAFTGNGLIGAMVYLTDDKSALRFRMTRSDVSITDHGTYRLPQGDLVLVPVGKITGGKMRMDLWNAEVTGTLTTDKGEIAFRTFTHANDLIQVINLKPTDGEKDCHWQFQPGIAADPRAVKQKTEIPADQKNPQPVQNVQGDTTTVQQKLNIGAEFTTAWKEVPSDSGRTTYLSISFMPQGGDSVAEATKAISAAAQTGEASLEKSHCQWWHNFYPASFLSVPDTRLESFYWIQMYKLGSATRADRPCIDLMGPWFNDTPWPRIWWNLNIQLTYYPVYPSNHLDLGESLCKMLDKNAANLAKNAGEFSEDSDTVSRSTGYDDLGKGGDEMCDLPWTIWNYYMQYRYSMDDDMLRNRLFIRLKRAMNWYFHYMKEGDDGKLHTTRGYSPEFPDQPKPEPDCNIDLALIRWGCQALLDTCDRLKIDDPLIPKWKDTLARLTPYPTDENGLKISAEQPFNQSHRHYSHMLMIYPLYLMNWDQPENHDLITKSLDHWLSDPKAFRGYSWTGASSICAEIGRPDDAVKDLHFFVDAKGRYGAHPNTQYEEAGPVIETPLSAARSLQDIVIQSWGGTIRVFPGVPDAWADATIDKMRTEGAFLVSAARHNGKTQWIKIESLAGEPCKLKWDEKNLHADHDVPLKQLDNNVWDIGIKKGESIILYPNGSQPDLTLQAVAADKDHLNTFGVP